MKAVIDAAALLAVLLDEPDSEVVLPYLRKSVMSAVNVSESFSRGVERGAKFADITYALKGFELEVAAFDIAAAQAAVLLRPATRSFGISLGDRACLVLGQARTLPILTGDRRLGAAGQALGIDIRLIR